MMIKTRKYNLNNILTTSMQVSNIVESLTDSLFSSLPGSCGSLYLINMNTIDDEGVEINEAGIYLLSVCLVCTGYGFISINIMCIHIHAQNHLGLKAQGKQGILICFIEGKAETFLK